MRTMRVTQLSRRSVLLTASLTSLVLAGCGDGTGPGVPNAAPGRSFEDHFHWSGQITRDDHIVVRGIAGPIKASLAPGNEVVVTAIKSGPADARRKVAINVQVHDGGVTVCAQYPDSWGELPETCDSGWTGRLEVDDAVQVTFDVQVPADVDFFGSTVAGAVEATGLRSDAVVQTVTGDLRVSTTRLAEATAVTGSVYGSIGLTDWDRDLRFTTVTGDVTVEIPAAANAHVRASTVNGQVDSEFPLTRTSSGYLQGTIGSGGPTLRLSTVNGNVELQLGS